MRHIYADFIGQVDKPARYLGGEYLQVVKPAAEVDARIVLAFPDVYEIGMSHLGTKILYSLLNNNERIACERAFTPWVDMEQALRERELPLVSLESSDPLSSFDVIGISLQFELTYSNVLTLLDLGGVALRSADRANDDPLVIGGGPTATHPEPLAPFFDAFFIGEAEQSLEALVLEWSAMRRGNHSRLDALAELASRHPIYVPALYDTALQPETGLQVVTEPRDPRAPRQVQRAPVAKLDEHPFPSDSPVPFAEAVFDRQAVEIARGCTEGCRFCQAGMIYRPVRERSPKSIVDSLVGGVETGGYDETSLTSLSTADYSCITPLVKEVMGELRDRKVSLSVSSLRAYGLNEDLLDELSSVRATGLTFAPEAGTQRMRDVVNKNVTEQHIEQSAHRVFSRGWHRLKLYFMIGLPTEQDEDVRAIIDTGAQVRAIGRQRMGRKADVTISVSTHVPKPHTPFQWCAMDNVEEIRRKQRILREAARDRGLRVKHHGVGGSYVEGVFARGDRRLADALELAWRRGARFDGWDELFDLDRWQQAFDETGVEVDHYLAELPVEARLPWDHIDVGLADGFLAKEYRMATKDRLSPPCGKPVGQLIHHTNVQEAEADTRKLVCYDCGVDCDMEQMREERVVMLRELGALEPTAPVESAAPRGQASGDRRPRPRPQFAEGEKHRYRVRFTKVGRAAFLGHLDLVRMLARLLRRAQLDVAYSRGFHPKPILQFGPALSLGVPGLGELVDISLENSLPPAELLERLNAAAPAGIVVTGCALIPEGMRGLGKVIDRCDLLVQAADDAERLVGELLAKDSAVVARKDKQVDVRPLVLSARADRDDAVCAELEWEPTPLVRVELSVGPNGSAKPMEVATALGLPGARVARLGLLGAERCDPLTATK